MALSNSRQLPKAITPVPSERSSGLSRDAPNTGDRGHETCLPPCSAFSGGLGPSCATLPFRGSIPHYSLERAYQPLSPNLPRDKWRLVLKVTEAYLSQAVALDVA